MAGRNIHKFGPGTVTATAVGGSAYQFECQVKGVEITTEYTEVSEEVVYLGGRDAGCYESAVQERKDSISMDIDHDLTATGLYQWCQTYDLQEADVVYVPNTAMGTETPAAFALRVVVTSPNVNADEYGVRLDGTIEWAGVGKVDFTPAVDTVAP